MQKRIHWSKLWALMERTDAKGNPLESVRDFTISPDGILRIEAIRHINEIFDFFPPLPTQEQFLQGGRHFERSFAVIYGRSNIDGSGFRPQGEGTITTWLEAVRT